MAARKMTRRTFLKTLGQVTATYALAGAGSYVYGSQVEARWIEVKRLTLPLRNLPAGADGLRIVQLSDFHPGQFAPLELVRAAVDQANALRPDLIVLTGDYVTNAASEVDALAPELSRLNARLGVFASLGNHDWWTDPAYVTQRIEAAGPVLLINRSVTLPGGLRLAGVDDMWSGQPDLAAALAGQPADEPVILLAHEPDFADDYLQDPRVALMLSGHTHGGQVMMPGYDYFLPRYGKRYPRGLYRLYDRWLYTNAGIGLALPGFRLGCRPEVTEFTLTQA